MKYSLFMTITAAVAFLFGLSFILIPVQTLSIYGVTLDASGQFLGRYLGSTFLGVAVLAWLFRNTPASATRLYVTQALFVVSVLGLVVAVYDKFAGVGNALVWLNVVIYLLLAAGFGYFIYVKPNAS